MLIIFNMCLNFIIKDFLQFEQTNYKDNDSEGFRRMEQFHSKVGKIKIQE